MRPVLDRKTGAVFSPKDIVVDMNATVLEKAHIYRTLLDRKRPPIFSRMVFEPVHVLTEQLAGILVAEQANCGGVAEQASPFRITAKDSFTNRVENQTSALFAKLERFFRAF